MKKIIVVFVVISLVLTACSSQKEDKSKEQSNEPVFTKEDIQLAKDIIQFVNKKEEKFVKEANKKLKNGQKKYGIRDENGVRDRFRSLSQKMILKPLVKEYGDHIIKYKDENLATMVNVDSFTWNGQEKEPSQTLRVFKTYQDLTLKKSKVKHHKNQILDMHELIIPVNEEKTKIFASGTKDVFHYTFYKTKEGKLIVGELPPLSWNAHIIDFETKYKEDLKAKLKQLPPLQ